METKEELRNQVDLVGKVGAKALRNAADKNDEIAEKLINNYERVYDTVGGIIDVVSETERTRYGKSVGPITLEEWDVDAKEIFISILDSVGAKTDKQFIFRSNILKQLKIMYSSFNYTPDVFENSPGIVPDKNIQLQYFILISYYHHLGVAKYIELKDVAAEYLRWINKFSIAFDTQKEVWEKCYDFVSKYDVNKLFEVNEDENKEDDETKLEIEEAELSNIDYSQFMKVEYGNIIEIKDVDAIVNPTNKKLGGLKLSGIDKIINDAAGKKLREECKKIGRCEVGSAVITGAFNLSCKYIIHTVGPKWDDGKGKEKELLASCYKSILDIAIKYDIRSIAIPAISTGNFGFPSVDACDIAVKTVKDYISEHSDKIDIVKFVLFDKESERYYIDAFERYEI